MATHDNQQHQQDRSLYPKPNYHIDGYTLEDPPATGTPPGRIQAILDAVPQDADRVLDVGCARHDATRRERGDLHARLVEHVDGDVTGIDILEDEVAAMQLEGYDARVADAQDFQLDEEFDVVVAGDIIEHLPEPGGMLDSIHRHLTPDGELVVTTPNAWCWFFTSQSVRGGVHCNEEHKCWYDARTLRQTLEASGYTATVEHVDAVPESVPQRWLKVAFRVASRLPLPACQRAPVLLATATPESE